ncbi:MAG TPA: putative selenium-dependent hydroxylase accessory protein YqeC [Clostridiales bacterium]|nr:putative selenium-dependent hydroxylase accessory protein YqeC [Clostridiales bacterium]
MNYINALNIDVNQKTVITVTGSGGKTTIISELANQLLEAGKKVVITTTTKIYLPEANNAITILNETILKHINLQYQGIVFAGKSIDSNNKLQGFTNEEISMIHKNPNINFLIIEGDGSKRLPIKGYAFYEPVVPDTTDILISVIGLNAIGKTVDDTSVHRIDKFEEITGKSSGATIGKEDIIKLILSPDGYFKCRGKKNYLILNQVNDNIYHVVGAVKDELEKKASFIEKIIINGEKQ